MLLTTLLPSHSYSKKNTNMREKPLTSETKNKIIEGNQKLKKKSRCLIERVRHKRNRMQCNMFTKNKAFFIKVGYLMETMMFPFMW